MADAYKLRNPFYAGSRLTADEVVGIITAFMNGVPPTEVAKHQRTGQSLRRLYRLLRLRLFGDDYLRGEIVRVFLNHIAYSPLNQKYGNEHFLKHYHASLFTANHKCNWRAWDDIYHCIYNCPHNPKPHEVIAKRNFVYDIVRTPASEDIARSVIFAAEKDPDFAHRRGWCQTVGRCSLPSRLPLGSIAYFALLGFLSQYRYRHSNEFCYFFFHGIVYAAIVEYKYTYYSSFLADPASWKEHKFDAIVSLVWTKLETLMGELLKRIFIDLEIRPLNARELLHQVWYQPWVAGTDRTTS